MDKTPGSISDPQAKYIRDLVAKKDLIGNVQWTPTHEQLMFLRAGDYSRMSKDAASKAINNLLKLNDKPPEPNNDRLPAGSTSDDEALEQHDADGNVVWRGYPPDDHPAPVPTPVLNLEAAKYLVTNDTSNPQALLAERLTELEGEVDAGYYFIVNPDLANGKRHDPNDGERFYHVSKPDKNSRWYGRTFIESRGGDFLYKVKDMESRVAILTEIAKDPITAMNEYGIRLGVCGCCGRTLTAKDSRLRGLGPICAERILGAPTQSQLELLHRLGLKK